MKSGGVLAHLYNHLFLKI